MNQEYIEKTFDTILQDANTVPAITESTFKLQLLPILADTSKDADFSPWLNIAGTWQRPIDVVDDVTNEVLFRVPALVGKTTDPVKQNGHTSAYEIISNAQRKIAVLPKAGEEYLTNNLGRRIGVDGNRIEAARTWNYIFERYGLSHLKLSDISEGDADNTQVAEEQSVSVVQISGYDEA